MTQAIDARDDEIAEGVDGGRFERVDLLGDAHRAELGADARADPARQQQRRRQRAGFADERDREARGNHRLGAEALERRAGVHREHDADRHPRHGDERRRPEPELVDLADGFAEFERREEQPARAALPPKIDTSPTVASRDATAEPDDPACKPLSVASAGPSRLGNPR